MEFVSKIVATDANLEKATLWIPNNALPATIDILGRRIVEESKPTGWRFWIHL